MAVDLTRALNEASARAVLQAVRAAETHYVFLRTPGQYATARQMFDEGEIGIEACLTPVLQVGGARVTTIEGLGRDGLTRLQAAFVRHGALQCGFCTPGLVMTATAILAELPRPTEAEVRRRLVGNVCRCTGYTKIVEAILDAAGTAGA